MLNKLKWALALPFLFLFSCVDRKNLFINFKVIFPKDIGIDFVHNNAHNIDFKFPEIMGAGVSVFDYDLDGDLDLYFVQSGNSDQSDQLYKSLLIETGKLKFENVTNYFNIKQTNFGMGITIGDYNNDGFPDLFLSNLKSNVLLKNVNGKSFEDVTIESNLFQNNNYTSMSSFVDLNNDGWLDLILSNYINYNEGHEPECIMLQGKDYCGPSSFSYQKNNVLQNKSGMYYEIPELHSGFNLELPSLVLVTFDLTNDGLSDIYIGNDEKSTLYG